MGSISQILSIMCVVLTLVACTPNEEIWSGTDKNPIEVVCGKACQTIQFHQRSVELSSAQQHKINQFVYHTTSEQRIYVSPCVTNPDNPALNEDRIRAVKGYIERLGYRAVRLKPTLAANLETKNCVNLVKGKLYLYVQHCPNKTLNPSVQEIGSNFGCANNYNLAQMIVNPWNLLALPGDNGTEGDRVALGIKNYRTGKLAKIDTEGSS